MKKRLMASLFVCMFSLTLIPTASAAGYAPPTLPDAFQGDGLYITATPFKLPLDVDFVLGSNDTGGFHGGWIGFTTGEEERDEYGYVTGSYAAVHYIDRNGTVFETDADITDNVGSNFGQSDVLQFYIRLQGSLQSPIYPSGCKPPSSDFHIHSARQTPAVLPGHVPFP